VVTLAAAAAGFPASAAPAGSSQAVSFVAVFLQQTREQQLYLMHQMLCSSFGGEPLLHMTQSSQIMFHHPLP
jgi:hypothetical protein